MSFSDGVNSHEEGHVAVCYSADGKQIITGGTEGDIKIYSNGSTTNPQSFFADAFNISAIKQWKTMIVAASEGWSLQQWTFPEGEKMGVLGRFSGNITHFSLNFDQDKILVGSAEFSMKITDLVTEEQHTIKSHTAPILRTSFGKKYIASSSCDGTLRFWSAASRECLKTLDLYPKSNDVDLSKVRGAIIFDKDENLIAAKEQEVAVYSANSWEEKCVLKCDDTSSLILELELSHCKRYLVVAHKDGTLVIWDTRTYKMVNTLKCVSVPSSISAHPHEYKLLVGDNKGTWRECEGYITSEMVKNNTAVVNNNTTTAAKPPHDDDSKFFLDDEAGEEFPDWDDDDQDIMNIDREEDDIKPVVSKNAAIFNEDDDEEDDEPSIAAMAKLPEISHTPPILEEKVPELVEPEYVGPELQDAFQVSSSPDFLKQRYLVWNEVGIIISRVEGDNSYINVEFHDTQTHHPLHIANPQGYSLGSLSKVALALATSGSEENTKCSSLLVNVFSSWSASKEWTVQLPKHEHITLLSASAAVVCVVTDLLYVRVWSVGGLQRHVFSIPGEGVTLATYNNLLSVLHYAGTTLSLSLYDCKKPRLVYSRPAPLSPASTCTWAGFTEGGLPLIYDSESVLRALLPQSGLMWVPLCDLRVGKHHNSDTFWVTAVSDSAIRCILCKGMPYPGVTPRPVLSVHPFTVPLCDSGSERSTLEQNRILNQVSTYRLNNLNTFEKECRAEDVEKEEVTLLIKLMALAVKNNRDYKAYEIARMLPNKRSLELASRYASKSGHVVLAQKINAALRNYEEEENVEDDDIFEVSEVSYHTDTLPHPSDTRSAPNSVVGTKTLSMAKKRISQIDVSVAPIRLNTKPTLSAPKPVNTSPKPEQTTEDEVHSPAKESPDTSTPTDNNPFSVKSSTIQNTQRRSTSFLDTIESKSLEQEQKRKSMQKVLSKPQMFSLSDLGKHANVQKSLIPGKKPAAAVPKKPKPSSKPKKVTGYALWFEGQPDKSLVAKQGPLKWRRIPQEEKDVWLEKARDIEAEKEKNTPSISITNSFQKKDNTKVSTGSDETERAENKTDDQKEKKTDDQKEKKTDDQKENKTDDQKENKNANKPEPTKRKVSSDSNSDSDQPAKKLAPSRTENDSNLGIKPSADTKSKLAAFQFKKKSNSAS